MAYASRLHRDNVGSIPTFRTIFKGLFVQRTRTESYELSDGGFNSPTAFHFISLTKGGASGIHANAEPIMSVRECSTLKVSLLIARSFNWQESGF